MLGTELLGHIRGRAEMLQSWSIRVAPDVMADGADRWILASLLQKAIRRGHCALALGAALKLLQIDSSRLWRRLMTVALEDVGVGDLDIALDLVAISSSPVARRVLGGSCASLETMIPWACRAIKDRTADHLASLARWQRLSDGYGGGGSGETDFSVLPLSHRAPTAHPGVPLHRTADATGVSPDDIRGLNASVRQMPAVQPQHDISKPTWQDHVYAAFALAGAWERGRLKLEEILDHFGRQGAPLALLEACSAYGRRCGDPLFLYALTAWIIWKKEGPEPLALARQGLAGQDLGELPDYALDPLRTRLGRRGVELWLRSYLEKVPFDSRQVMAGLWNAEASLSNQILFWEAGGQIQRAAYQSDLLVHGLAPERHEDLLAWIAQERPVLFAARQMVWQSHVRSLRETDRQQASPPRLYSDAGGGGDGYGYGRGGIGIPSSDRAGNHPDSPAAHGTDSGGSDAAQDRGAGAGPAHSWPDDASASEDSGQADRDEDAGSAAHHAIFTPYLPDEETCLAQP